MRRSDLGAESGLLYVKASSRAEVLRLVEAGTWNFCRLVARFYWLLHPQSKSVEMSRCSKPHLILFASVPVPLNIQILNIHLNAGKSIHYRKWNSSQSSATTADPTIWLNQRSNSPPAQSRFKPEFVGVSLKTFSIRKNRSESLPCSAVKLGVGLEVASKVITGSLLNQ